MLRKEEVKMMIDRGDKFIDEFVELTIEEITQNTQESLINLLNVRTKLMWLPYTNIKYFVESCSEGFFFATIKFKIRFYVDKNKFYEIYEDIKNNNKIK